MEASSANENLEHKVAKVFDPSVDLKTKISVAGEIRDVIDSIKDTDSTRVLPVLIPNVVDFLSNSEPSFRKDAPEYQFRRVNVEILNRLPYLDSVRPHSASILSCMLHLLRNDNEENAITACKTTIDVVRASKCLTDQSLAEFMSILHNVLSNMKTVVPDVLSEDSAILDPNAVPHSSRSFKVLSEMGMLMVVFAQTHRPLLTPAILQSTVTSIFEFLALESPAQKSARENYEAMGNIWAGMTPTIKNTPAYSDFLSAEIKLLSYVAWIMRLASDQSDNYGEQMVLLSMRLLQDCPANSIPLRKELISVFRHLISTPHRKVLVGHLDKLLDDRVLFGTGLASKELLRGVMYSAMADLFHHLKNDLSGPQLTLIANVYSRFLHDPALPTSLHTLFAKMVFHLVDALTVKESASDAAKILTALLEISLERLEALASVHEEIQAMERTKQDEQVVIDGAFIEKARPIGGASFAIEDVPVDSRHLYKTLLHGFRVILAGLKKVSAPVPDGTLMFRLFEGCIRCMALFDFDFRPNPNELSETIEWFAPILYELNLHVFQEVWLHKIDFFFEYAQKRIPMLNICQTLLTKESVSPTLLAIILKFLVDRLPMLGDYDDHRAAATIRLFKMAFQAVVLFPQLNEPILAAPLGKLLMDCFPLSVRAAKPSHYFHLLKVLFRCIGGGGGRFEQLYTQLLPLLPEMLECLNRQLVGTEGQMKDLIVELCLTVPLRLTNLLPHLAFLMHPLSLALRGGPEVVAQGLRTLELCIDNLSPHFLDPTLNGVLRDLMEALHSHLRPLPASHHVSHNAIRILGKLGGRNRRVLAREPSLNYTHHSEVAKFPVSFGGESGKVAISPMAKIACQCLKKGSPDLIQAYNLIEGYILNMLHEGVTGRNAEELFTSLVEGLFDAVHISEIQVQADQLVHKLSSTIFESELRSNHSSETYLRGTISTLLSAFLGAWPHALARQSSEDAATSMNLIASLVDELVSMKEQPNMSLPDIMPLLHLICNKFIALSLEDTWVEKIAACTGIKIMARTPEIGPAWIVERDLDLVRTLLHILKDITPDIPRDTTDVIDTLVNILRITHADCDFSADGNNPARNKVILFAGLFFADLNSPNPIVRQASQRCIGVLVELSKKTAAEILMPHRERMHHTLFTKPLRALPFPSQIGKIEATRYCVTLEPPLIELGDELLRLLHETLALADADEGALVGRVGSRQHSLEVTKLRVACIKLLTASMPLTDFFSRQHQTRQRVTGVYFKSLYSPSREVKDVAHEGLRMVLLHQSRLPKELLQTGLRPILMNLADPKRLSVPGLDGLARLLELLTNYFKVEIGHKLLDHFRVVADPQLLQSSTRLPLGENEGISKLVSLANIFHLLPSAAHTFLEQLVNLIVNTEAQMHFAGKSPFSEPLAKYLDRYSEEGIAHFMEHLHLPRHVRTLRSILQERLAPNLERALASRTSYMLSRIHGENLLLPTLLLFSDMASIIPSWIQENSYVVDVVIDIWRSEGPSDQNTVLVPEALQRHSLILSIFRVALEQGPRIDLLFEIVATYARNMPLDRVSITKFLYQHVAMSDDVIFRRNILMRFLTWFDDPSYSWSHKATFIRYIITPLLLVHASKPEPGTGLIEANFVDGIQRLIWRQIDTDTFADANDMFHIELLHFTTVMVQHYSQVVEPVKKHVIKCAWHYISISDDSIIKQTAFLLAARFFVTWSSPQKFILRAWAGILKLPYEGRALVRQEALATLVSSLSTSETNEAGYPQWATTARRLLLEEGFSQAMTIYHLMVKEPDLFYPVRNLFVPHIVPSLSKLGLSSSATPDSRMLSVELLHVIFTWDIKASKELSESSADDSLSSLAWTIPQGYKEIVLGYLIRLATQQDQAKSPITARALTLLQAMVGPQGWNDDVAYSLRFFEKALEQTEFTEQTVPQAVAAAKTLHVIASEQSDSWYIANAAKLQLLVRKGMVSEDFGLQDALHPIVDRLLRLYPLPKEEEEQQQGPIGDFHSFVFGAIGDGLRNATVSRGALLMLKSVVQVVPERIEPFAQALVKAQAKLTKDHLHPTSPITSAVFEAQIRLLTTTLDICQVSMTFLGAEPRRFLLTNIIVLVDKSKHPALCRYLLDMCRMWAFANQDRYPTMKERATVLQKMVVFETKSDVLFQTYLELIYDIYTEPSLRRSDLTSRLEQSFLLGCRAKDQALRERFIDLFDVSIPRSLFSRLVYICGVQSWEALAEQNWIPLALHLLLGAVEVDNHRQTHGQGDLAITRPKIQAIVKPMQRLAPLDIQAAHDTWISIFPAAWACLSRREQTDLTHHMINLLSRDYHFKQAEMRPNVIQTLLGGIHACSSPMLLPPHLVKYLAKTFGAWHCSLEMLTSSLDHVKEDEASFRDYVYDSFADIYAELAEEDVFYGLWRHRCIQLDTNIALTFEQSGMWEQALTAYENAQSRSRAGTIPFSESEYCLWEDHWILSAEKLQQWEVLHELARSEGNHELILESAWRTKDWTEHREALEEQILQLSETPTPRRRIFEAFIALLKSPSALEKNLEFTKILEDAMQLTLRKWVNLPPSICGAHIPLLQHFQQFVELQEAVQIFGSLSQTNASNLEKKSAELKMVLEAWRERLPNLYDDIAIWSDLIAWRQNVFHAINNAYIPLIQTTNGTSSTSTNTYAYRGYHETAWIINRFAHVARKHDLLDVCSSSLAKIYTLPNIEISEAFLKLREQARCYYQKPTELQAGLEVINNTNLVYFSTSQKAAFSTLKGMFYARLGRNDDANTAFGQAVQLDMSQPKAWAEWGRYNDKMFKENPSDQNLANNAVSCYLQAAGQYKSAKSRPLLARVLWLLSLDDGSLIISRAFDTYKGDGAFWYWITLIPQLCTSIAHREVKQARYILQNLARHYPQALFFQMRTTREEMINLKKQATMRAAMTQATVTVNGDTSRRPSGETANEVANAESTSATPTNGGQQDGSASTGGDNSLPRATWEYMEEIVQVIKTAFPLLILSMETLSDQFLNKFKPSSEDDVYRSMNAFIWSDALQNIIIRSMTPDDEGQLTTQSVNNLMRLATIFNGQSRKDFETDFIINKPNIYELLQRLQKWRDRSEKIVDARPRFQSLDTLGHYWTEFQYAKVDEIEVFGQYTEDKDNNQQFVKIHKFYPKFENCKSAGVTWKRITIIGNDHSRTSFSVQTPCHRQCRREEKVMQLFRSFNGVLSRKKEGRKRNLNFHLPAVVAFSSNLRLIQTDSSYIALGDVYDLHCERHGFSREEPLLYGADKCRKVLRDFRDQSGRQPAKPEYIIGKKTIFDEVTSKMVPDDILTKYMIQTMDDPSDLWRMRKQFALQVASCSFMTYVVCLSGRVPGRFNLSRTTGLMTMSEVLPGLASQNSLFMTHDVVPFRFTPNMQTFLGPIFTEGLLAAGIMSIARCLTEPEFDLDFNLCLFSRDEVAGWMALRGRQMTPDAMFRQSVSLNIEAIVKRAETMACKIEREQALQNTPLTVPVFQTVTNLISTATNPAQLVKMGDTFYPWF